MVIFALVALSAPQSADSSELRASYLVEFKAFRSSVSAGDQLTFELYSDPNCQSLVQSELVPAGSSQLIIEKVNTQKVNMKIFRVGCP